MSKKHYIAIAKILAANYVVSGEPVKFVLRDITDQLCQYFKQDNPNFNREKFIAATIEAVNKD